MVKALRFAVGSIFITGIVLWVALSNSIEPVLTLAAILIHELGHIFASLLCKCNLKKFSFQFGGLLLSGSGGYTSYFTEAAVAFFGPFFNLVSACAFWSAELAPLVFFRQVSLALAILNLLPINEFDGGRILQCAFNSFLPLEYSEKLCGIFSFLALFFLWNISVYLVLKTGRNLSAFIFSIMIFFKIIKKTPQKEFARLSENNRE